MWSNSKPSSRARARDPVTGRPSCRTLGSGDATNDYENPAATPPKITLVGAGLAGSLLAIFLARRGYRVTLLERRLGSTEGRRPRPGRSINLALANRGIAALEEVGVMESVRSELIPMAGRMLHDEEGRLKLDSLRQQAA